AATSTIKVIADAVKIYGTQVTLAEILAAGVVEGAVAAGIAEVATAVGALAASFYVGACVGSLIACTFDWASARLSKRTALAIPQVRNFLSPKDIELSDDLEDVLFQNPEMRGARKTATFEVRMASYM